LQMRFSFNSIVFGAASLGLTSLAAESDPLKMKLRVTMKDYDTQWFENRINHFDEKDSRTYK